MAANNRIVYSTQAVGFAKEGTSTFLTAHGLQSCAINTNFNLEDVFEIGQSNVYQIVEDLPDIQATMSKVLDGYPLLYHLATNGAVDGSLQGRGNVRTIIALSVFPDVQSNASGNTVTQCECSGMFYNGGTWTFNVDGSSTEEANFVGNNKIFRTGSFTYTGSTTFNGNDAPSWGGGVVRRQHFDWGTSRVPLSLPGISSSGTNDANNLGYTNCAVQSIAVSFDLGRQNINELGHKGPYFRFPNPIVDVTTTINIVNKSGDMVAATEAGTQGNGNNLVNETILVTCRESTKLDCGSKNKLSGVSMNGGDTGGGIQTIQYTYVNKNFCTVTHSADPSGL